MAVSDKTLIDAVERYNTLRAAGESVGLAEQTVKNRVCALRKEGVEIRRQMRTADETPKLDELMNKNGERARAAIEARKRLVITAAQNATPVNQPFFDSLLEYCRHHHAELIVIPYRYKNPTSEYTDSQQNADWWDAKLLPYLLSEPLVINSNLMICGDVRIQPTAVCPLSGFDGYTGARSAIFGHPKLQLKTIPTPSNRLPKILTTTGSVTVQNYTDSKAGKKGEFHHTFGAAVVELVGDKFHLRQINAVRDGSFIDLTNHYSREGVKPAGRAKALITGDTHGIFLDPSVANATYAGKHAMCSVLRPEILVWHDSLDFYSRNHHHRNDPVLAYRKHISGMTDIKQELQATFDVIDKYTPLDTKSIIVRSNHDEALERWLKETDPRTDPQNMLFWCETMAACLRSIDPQTPRQTAIDPYMWWASRMMSRYGECQFLDRDQHYMVEDIDVGSHGDLGANGSRGSIRQFTRIGCKMVIGHSHSPGIEDGIYQVGVSAYLNLGYNRGPSGWLQTHCVIYANGKRSLIHIIDGQWRA